MTASPDSLTIPVPAAAKPGDLLVAALSIRVDGASRIDSPAGWNLLRQDQAGSSANALTQAVYYQVVVATGAAIPNTWTYAPAAAAAGAMLDYVGMDPTTPVDVSSGRPATDTLTIVAPSVSPNAADDRLIAVFSDTDQLIPAPPAGMDVLVSIYSNSTNDTTLQVDDEALSSSGPTGDRVATLSSSRRAAIGQAIALRRKTAPVNVGLPVISGAPNPGMIVTASLGSWTELPTSFSYAWERCDALGTGCTSVDGTDTFAITLADLDSTLKATVTASNDVGSASATSVPVHVVGRTFYLSPDGDDANSGTSTSAPWKTFQKAVPVLTPGDTLLLLDGTYNKATGTGYLQVECRRTSDNPACINALPPCSSANVPQCALSQQSGKWIPSFATGQNGTSSAPITVAALNPRRAYLRGDGSEISPIYLDNCAFWTIDGLRAREDDAVRAPVTYSDGSAVDVATAGVFQVTCSDNVILRRVFGEYNNRLYNTDVIAFLSSRHGSVIESEAYNHHRHGMSACCRGPSFVVDATQYTQNTALVSAEDVAFERDYVDAQPTPGGAPCDATGWSTPGSPTGSGQVLCGYDLVCDYQTPPLCGHIPGTEAWCAGLASGARCAAPALSHGAGTMGDEGITQYWTDHGYIENSITLHGEGQHATGSYGLIHGGAVLSSSQGVHLGRNQSGQGAYVDFEGHNVAENMVVIGDASNGTGLYLCGGNHDQARKLTVLTAYRGLLGYGWGATNCQPGIAGAPIPEISFDFQDVLVVNAQASGTYYAAAVLGSPTCWHGESINIWPGPSGQNYSPTPGAAGNWYAATTLAVTNMYDPATGEGDIVWVPPTSNMSTAGGADGSGNASSLGANVTCIYDRGVNTGASLWDVSGGTGRFAGCSWYPDKSAADIAYTEGYALRCSNIHQALNVGANGGMIPPCITAGANAVEPVFAPACP